MIFFYHKIARDHIFVHPKIFFKLEILQAYHQTSWLNFFFKLGKSGDFAQYSVQNWVDWYMNRSLFLEKFVFVWVYFQIPWQHVPTKSRLEWVPPQVLNPQFSGWRNSLSQEYGSFKHGGGNCYATRLQKVNTDSVTHLICTQLHSCIKLYHRPYRGEQCIYVWCITAKGTLSRLPTCVWFTNIRSQSIINTWRG